MAKKTFKELAGRLTLPDFKTGSKATVIHRAQYWHWIESNNSKS
jgi:hypothetical protein